jgi:hypothetical protein
MRCLNFPTYWWTLFQVVPQVVVTVNNGTYLSQNSGRCKAKY